MQSRLSKVSFNHAKSELFLAAGSFTSLCYAVPVALFFALDAVFEFAEPGSELHIYLLFPPLLILHRGVWLLRNLWYGHFDVEVEIGDWPEQEKEQLNLRIPGIWLGFVLLAWLARYVSPAADTVVMVIAALLMPALFIALAASFARPQIVAFYRLWFVIATIGWRYLWMCPGMLLFALGTNRLFDKRYGDTALFFVSFGLELLANLAALLSFAMMGYFLHTKSDQLGAHPFDLEAKSGKPAPPDSEPSKLLAGGRTSEALAALQVAARLAPLNVHKQQRYYTALMRYAAEDAQFANRKLQQAGYLLRAYARAERAEDVARMMEQWWPALQKELLRQTALCLQVATLCVQGGAHERALQLFTAFERARNGSLEMPGMMLAHAQLLLTLQRPAEAASLAQEIVKRFPQSDQAHRAQAILQLPEPAV